MCKFFKMNEAETKAMNFKNANLSLAEWEHGQITILNKDGQPVTDFFDKIGAFDENGVAIVYRNGMINQIDSNGEICGSWFYMIDKETGFPLTTDPDILAFYEYVKENKPTPAEYGLFEYTFSTPQSITAQGKIHFVLCETLGYVETRWSDDSKTVHAN